MQNSDHSQRKPGDSRKRDFEDADDSTKAQYTPLRNSMDNSFARLRRQLIKKLNANDLKTLEEEMKKFSGQFITQFFETEYPAIFHWLFIEATNINAFEFLLKKFPSGIFQEKLRENNFLFLTSFLNSRAAMEGLGLLTSGMRELDREKFTLLLAIDFEGIKSFMEKNKESRFMKPATWQDYESALASYNSNRSLQLK